MSNQHDDSEIPLTPSRAGTEEQRRLIAFFSDLETKQLDFLDNAAKSLVERGATMLAVIFAIIAFGDKFPPSYLVGNETIKTLIIVTLVSYIISMACGMLAANPRQYTYNLGKPHLLQEALNQMLRYKSRFVRLSAAAFWLGSGILVILISAIVLKA